MRRDGGRVGMLLQRKSRISTHRDLAVLVQVFFRSQRRRDLLSASIAARGLKRSFCPRTEFKLRGSGPREFSGV